MIDIIARQIRHIGETLENDINRIWLNNILENAGGEHDTAGSNQGVPALNAAAGVVDAQDFQADSFVTHPEFRTALFDDTNLVYVNRSGNDQVLRERETDRIMGLTHFPVSGSTYDGATHTFGYAANGEIGGAAFQRDHVWLVIAKDIEIKDYEDPIRDLQGVNARAWVDSVLSQPNAVANIEY